MHNNVFNTFIHSLYTSQQQSQSDYIYHMRYLPVYSDAKQNDFAAKSVVLLMGPAVVSKTTD